MTYQPAPLLHPRRRSISSTVPAIDTVSDPRQPSRFEKKANTGECYAECMDGPTSRVVLSRQSAHDVKQRQVFVSMDGTTIATLLFGEVAAVDVAPGRHVLRAHNTLVWKTITIDLRPGEEARFTIVNRPGLGTYAMLSLLGTGPIYLTFEREKI